MYCSPCTCTYVHTCILTCISPCTPEHRLSHHQLSLGLRTTYHFQSPSPEWLISHFHSLPLPNPRMIQLLVHSPLISPPHPARSSSHFVMNSIMAKDWLNRQSKFCQMTDFQQSAKISSCLNFRPYGTYILCRC